MLHFTADDVKRVFDVWASLAGGNRALSAPRVATISKALKVRAADDVVVMLEWVWKSEDKAAKWLRGEDPKSERAYLDLANLMVVSKLDARCESAAEWKASASEDHDEPAATGVTLPKWAAYMSEVGKSSNKAAPKAIPKSKPPAPTLHSLDDED